MIAINSQHVRDYLCLFKQLPVIILMLCIFPTSSYANDLYIFGVVFTDVNRNGLYDVGEPVHANHDLYLEDLTLINQGKGGNFSAISGDDGKYFFKVQSIGQYNIYTDLGDMQLVTPIAAEGFMPPYSVSITSPGQIVKVDFGLLSADAPPLPSLSEVSSLLDGQILHVACNGTADDQSNSKLSVENKNVSFIRDKLGHRGRACFFGGAGYLRVPKSAVFNLSNYTIASWFFVESGYYNGTDQRAIVSNYAGSGAQHYGINMRDGVAGTFYTSKTNTFEGARDTGNAATAIADGQWHHVAVVVESGVKATLYVDGVAKKEGGSVPSGISPTGDLFIGRGGVETFEKRWIGGMDDIRILNRALSGDEVNQLLGIVDLPTGETITPLGVKERDPFVISAEDTSINPLMVTPNPDGGYSLSMLASGIRNGNKTVLPPLTSTFTMNPDGSVTLLDEAQPGVVANMNAFGDLTVTDAKFPDLRVILQRNSSRFAFQSTEDPAIVVKVNHDGTLDIIDENQPHISVTRHKDGSYTIVDRNANTTTLVDKNGDAVLRHADYPTVAATFNVFESQGEYVLVDTIGGECLSVNADGTIVSNIRAGFLKKVVSFVGGAIKDGVKSAISTAANKITTKLIDSLISSITGTSLVATAKIALTSLSCWFSCLTPFAQFAVVGVAVAAVAVVVGAVIMFKKMKEEINNLRGQIQQLTATIQIQAQQIQRLEATVEAQAQTIRRLEETVAGLKQVVAQQAQTIDEQATRIAQLEAQVAAQEDRIARQEQINADLQQRLQDLEQRLEQASEGVEAIPDGDRVGAALDGEKSGVREGQCAAIVANVRRILGFESVTPVNNCQLHAIHDDVLNDSILFKYDMENSATVQIGQVCVGCDIEALAVHPMTGEIYVGSGDNATAQPKGHLYKLDAVAGELRSIGNTGFTDISGLAFDNENTLWGWAKGKGLLTLNVHTGEGKLVQASSEPFADITWDASEQALYGVLGKDLWRYVPANGEVKKVCDNLPNKTEAIRVLPSGILPEGLVLLGAHLNRQSKLQVFDIVNCQAVANQAIFVGYDDVEGFDLPMAACQ